MADADEEIVDAAEEAAAPEPIEEVEMSVLDALKEVRVVSLGFVWKFFVACQCNFALHEGIVIFYAYEFHCISHDCANNFGLC
jgi:hypothetical protein